MRIETERALWLANNALPHEPALRRWLAQKQIAGIEIDDVVQETYATLTRLESVEGVRNPQAYMFQTAWSIMLVHFRRARVVSIQSVADVEALAGADDAPSPERTAGDRDELRRLASALADLPPRCREVFVLRKIKGFSQREVARRLQIGEGAVEKQVHRGVHILMDMLGRGGRAGRETTPKSDRADDAKRIDNDGREEF